LDASWLNIMNEKQSKASTGCPYFLAEMKTCRLYSNGFYLPPKKIVKTYCVTSQYKKCDQYQRHHPNEKDDFAPRADEYGDRRRYKRIPEHRKALVRSCDSEGNIVGDFRAMALTVDYSQGGMRIVSNKKIPPDTLLVFNFDHDFLIPQLHKIAQLCWQKSFENPPHSIEAGLLFKDNSSRETLSIAIEGRGRAQ